MGSCIAPRTPWPRSSRDPRRSPVRPPRLHRARRPPRSNTPPQAASRSYARAARPYAVSTSVCVRSSCVCPCAEAETQRGHIVARAIRGIWTQRPHLRRGLGKRGGEHSMHPRSRRFVQVYAAVLVGGACACAVCSADSDRARNHRQTHGGVGGPVASAVESRVRGGYRASNRTAYNT